LNRLQANFREQSENAQINVYPFAGNSIYPKRTQ